MTAPYVRSLPTISGAKDAVALGALPRLPSLAMIPRCPGFSLAGRRDSARAVSTRKISACAQFRIRGERIPAERELGP